MEGSIEIILFGDAKGTKYHLQKSLFTELAQNMSDVHNSFSKTFLEFYDQSRNLHCFTISDSVIAKWTNEGEGIRYCIPFAIDFFSSIKIPYRIFIDSGKAISNKTGYSPLGNSLSNRYHNILPISFGIWSVSVAESSHFPEGIFVGQNLLKKLNGIYDFIEEHKAQEFIYKKLKMPTTKNNYK